MALKAHHFKIEKLPVLFLREGLKFVAYTPALDISTCGNTFEQAKKRFAEALDIFFQELVKMGTLDQVLSDCGWTKVARPRAHWVPPVLIGQEQQSISIPSYN